MSPEKTSIIEKIKKLFALSKSSNPHEAALALKKAREAMIQHNIEENDLNASQVEDIIEIDFQLSARYNIPTLLLATKLGETFFTKALLVNTPTGFHKVDKKVRFIGTKSDVAVSTYIFCYMSSLIATKSKEYIADLKKNKKKTSAKVKQDFAIGFVDAFIEKLNAMIVATAAERQAEEGVQTEVDAAEKALVIYKQDQLQKYIQQNFGGQIDENYTQSTTTNVSHQVAGYAEGRKYGIHRGVGTNQTNLKIGA